MKISLKISYYGMIACFDFNEKNVKENDDEIDNAKLKINFKKSDSKPNFNYNIWITIFDYYI